MRNLAEIIAKILDDKKKVLSLFVTVGYPTIESTVPLVVALANAGTDVIELGIPFSDPITDGPTIQASSEMALRNGVTLKKVFEMAKEIRKQTTIPLVLMGYSNPIFAYGLEYFLQTCHEVGIDGAIIPDISLEESKEYRTLGLKYDVATIFLAAPTTSNVRLAELDNASTGFLYCVSVTGVTGEPALAEELRLAGERRGLARQTEEFLQRAHKVVKKNPLLVGFGIATPDDARNVAKLSDGVIIGSTLIKLIQNSSQNHLIEKATEFVNSIRRALDT